MELIKRYQIETVGKHCVVGRSHIVGSLMSILMARNAYPVTVPLHLPTAEPTIKDICPTADILIIVLGRAEFITADMVKDEGVIDAGITRQKSDKTKSIGN